MRTLTANLSALKPAPTLSLQAQHPPYLLPHQYAIRAREVMEDALALGIAPPKEVWASLMDAQVRV